MLKLSTWIEGFQIFFELSTDLDRHFQPPLLSHYILLFFYIYIYISVWRTERMTRGSQKRSTDKITKKTRSSGLERSKVKEKNFKLDKRSSLSIALSYIWKFSVFYVKVTKGKNTIQLYFILLSLKRGDVHRRLTYVNVFNRVRLVYTTQLRRPWRDL